MRTGGAAQAKKIEEGTAASVRLQLTLLATGFSRSKSSGNFNPTYDIRRQLHGYYDLVADLPVILSVFFNVSIHQLGFESGADGSERRELCAWVQKALLKNRPKSKKIKIKIFYRFL